MSDLEAYVSDQSQKEELLHLLKRGVHEDEPSVVISLRSGTGGTRRVLADALIQFIMKNHGPYTVQEVLFCSWGASIASKCGQIYLSAARTDHVCNEDCLWFIKEKGHSVIYIDCSRMQTETERLVGDMKMGGAKKEKKIETCLF